MINLGQVGLGEGSSFRGCLHPSTLAKKQMSTCTQRPTVPLRVAKPLLGTVAQGLEEETDRGKIWLGNSNWPNHVILL